MNPNEALTELRDAFQRVSVATALTKFLEAIPPGTVLITLSLEDAKDIADAITDEWGLTDEHGNPENTVYSRVVTAIREATG